MYDIEKVIIKNELTALAREGMFGIEKENVRVDIHGKISSYAHADFLGDKENNPYITTDFSECQVEMITPPLPSITETYGFLQTIQDVIYENIGDEFLWPQSAPPHFDNAESIPIAKYSAPNKDKEIYREKLAQIYGKERQLMSGIHFNFSFLPEFLQQLQACYVNDSSYQQLSQELSAQKFTEEVYLKLCRNFLRNRWLLVWLYGISPVTEKSFQVKALHGEKPQNSVWQGGLSIRTSCMGYRNKEDFILDYSSFANLQKSIDELVNAGKLISEKELYVPLRIKLDKQKNISHVEVRLFDLDPFCEVGVSLQLLHFTHLFLLYCLFSEEPVENFSEKQQNIAVYNQSMISCHGLNEEIILHKIIEQEEKEIRARDWAREIICKISSMAQKLGFDQNPFYKEALEDVFFIAYNPHKRKVHLLKEKINKYGFLPFHMQKAQEYKQNTLKKKFAFHGKEDMELSTQLLLKAAIRRGVAFEILDRSENFVRLTKENNEQYVCQATKTSLDNYSSILMMENKTVTKKVLRRHNIRVPRGKEYNDPFGAKQDFFLFREQAIVIKPKSTNFGLGISILKNNQAQDVFNKAVDMAFQHDKSILIEEFIKGREFRFFVLQNKVIGILHRVPANVSGDGIHSIDELVKLKNQNPLRQKGYRSPLEKISLGKAEEMFLHSQGLTFDFVPALEQTVYLRENSNISTGGDGIDYTDAIDASYKQIAVSAAKALNVQISGLDMMIEKIDMTATPENYAIIEMNFNPAIHIHCFPYQGKGRPLNEKILEALGF